MAKKALLVGCNYYDDKNVPKLHGCINDVKAMDGLIRHRFGFKNITILTDEKKNKNKPTRRDIQGELGNLIHAAKPGDTFLFYFSGGGARVPFGNKNETISVIVASDLKPITGKQILDKIKQLPATAIFTFICDSSYSGGLFQKNDPINSNVAVNVQNFGSKTIPHTSLTSMTTDVKVDPFNNGILFTSSKSNKESVEVYLNGDMSKAFSAYSSAIQAMYNSPQAVKPPEGKTNSAVGNFMENLLSILEFAQHPDHKYSVTNANAPFLGGYVARR